jgi:hypothetical protein
MNFAHLGRGQTPVLTLPPRIYRVTRMWPSDLASPGGIVFLLDEPALLARSPLNRERPVRPQRVSVANDNARIVTSQRSNLPSSFSSHSHSLQLSSPHQTFSHTLLKILYTSCNFPPRFSCCQILCKMSSSPLRATIFLWRVTLNPEGSNGRLHGKQTTHADGKQRS